MLLAVGRNVHTEHGLLPGSDVYCWALPPSHHNNDTHHHNCDRNEHYNHDDARHPNLRQRWARLRRPVRGDLRWDLRRRGDGWLQCESLWVGPAGLRQAHNAYGHVYHQRRVLQRKLRLRWQCLRALWHCLVLAGVPGVRVRPPCGSGNPELSRQGRTLSALAWKP